MIKKLLVLSFCSVLANTVALADEPVRLPDIRLGTMSGSEPDFETGPPLQEVRVVRVASASQPNGELIVTGQRTTQQTHTGQIRLDVFENGYGTGTIATINGRLLSLSSVIRVTRLCRRPDGGFDACRRGERADGFLRSWDIGTRPGDFVYQSTSAYAPAITHSTYLRIL